MCFALDFGMQVHGEVIKVGNFFDIFVGSAVVDLLAKCCEMELASKIFLWMFEWNSVSWNALLSGYVRMGDGEEALIKDPDVVEWSSIISCFNHQGINYEAAEFYGDMTRSVMRPNQFTLASLISISTDLGNLQYGNLDMSVCNALVTMYMLNGSIEEVYRVLEALTDWDLVSWNAFLSRFQDGNACYQGSTIFKQLFKEGFKPNTYTLISILRSCTSLSNGGFGQQVHGHIINISLEVMILWEHYTVCTLFRASSNSGATDAFSLLFSCFVQTVNYTCLQLTEWHKHPCSIVQLNQFYFWC
ncbi:hypothetical protein NE237_026826 [Protea cynaroides]|uniref:Pentatricopeptide repeat-containing protein n=1 Tax=Protea cynaroides TaxID=273540 RepID=A0A9Q0GMD9_9MAGN|nr:hypothetical protein NE237_026826 [Protea cynaroides]